tara:strand:+ start:14831 stop:15622 length:792 start_codon:yes stop_codon:yes gene_type:complete
LKNKNIFINADDFGRSEVISNNIIKTIESGMINSVSIMVDEKKEIYEKLNKLNIKKKLHINLTDYNPNRIFQEDEMILKKLTFMKLLLLKKKNRSVVFKEIDRQIDQYVKFFREEKILIDGHQHIHVIPWIYNYLLNQKNYIIKEIRLPKEEFFFGDIKAFLKLKFYRNLLAFVILNTLVSFFLKDKKYSPPYSGMIYSGMYNEKIFTNNYKFMKNKYDSFEIAFHPGFTNLKEDDQFYNIFFKYYSSEERKKEFNLAMKKLI